MTRVRRPLALALIVVAAVAASCAPTSTAERPPARGAAARVDLGPTGEPRRAYVIGAAGDIACEGPANGDDEPGSCQYDDTARLVRGTRLAKVLLLGDNQYERGQYADYLTYFEPTWGRALERLAPVPGNHEYGNDPSARPRGYVRYFGDEVRGPDRLAYYSYDLGACPDDPCWHLIALNSELCFAAGGCDAAADPSDPGPGQRMYAWLQADLAANADHACTLAYWHHPRFSHSTGSGASSAVGPLWDLLYAAHADLVLNGHSHNYQRWRPQDPSGALDPGGGIREFVVGTGGRSHYALQGEPWPENLAAGQDDAFGILRLRLKDAGYAWTWVSASGQPAFEDAGRARCV